jgi:hypothetical protein
MKAKTEDRALYAVTPVIDGADQIIARALEILASRMRKPGEVFTTPGSVKQYCQLKLGGLPHEVFGVLFLDVQNRLIEFEEMFRGTLTQTSVYLAKCSGRPLRMMPPPSFSPITIRAAQCSPRAPMRCLP